MPRSHPPVSAPVRRRDTRPVPSPSGLPRPSIQERLQVRVVGAGKPPLVLCNGFGCSQHIWHYLTPALAVQHQLVLFDYATATADGRAYTTLHDYARDVVALCEALDLRNAVLVGHSVGAMIALLAAIDAPERFAKAVLLAPSPYYVNEPGYRGGFDQADLEQLLTLVEGAPQQWASPLAGLLIGPTSPASLREELDQQFCEFGSESARHFARVAFLADNRADVPCMPLPTLVVQCMHDLAVPPEVGDYLLQHLPQATLVTLPTDGHCPHLSAPLETLAAMQAFLG